MKVSSKKDILLERIAELLTVPEYMEPDEWGAAFRVYADTTGVPGPRDPFLTPYMVPLGRAAASGKYKKAAAVTAAQSGKTETILDVIGQRLDQRPGPIIYVGPSKEFNTDQFEPRLMELFDESDRLASKVVRGKKNKKTLKIVAGVKVRLASAASSTALKSDAAVLALVDEYDEMMGNIKGQGDPLGLAEARGKTYADFVTLVVSTCGRGIAETHIDEVSGLEFWVVGDIEEIESPIWRQFQEGTMHHWAWQCPCCDEYFVPMMKHLDWPKGATAARARREAYLVCPNNGCIIHEGDAGETKADMNRTGIMIAPGQTIEDAKNGNNVPDNSTYSQWTSGLTSPFMSWGDMAASLVQSEMSGEEDKKQTVVNANFGELYRAGATGDMPEWQEFLDEKRLDYHRLSVPKGAIRLVMATDVQKRGLYYVIRGFGSHGSSWLVDHGYLLGDTGDTDVWDTLTDIMNAEYSGMYVEKHFIDAGFRPDKVDGGNGHIVYEYCRQYSHKCSPIRGRDTLNGRPYSVSKIEVKPDGKKRPYSLNLVHVNTDYFKSLVHSRVKAPNDNIIGGPLFLNLEADEEYAKQVLSEVRVITPGKPKPKWVKTRKDNHFLDCESMAAAAGFVFNVQKIPAGTERSWGEIVDDGRESPEPTQEQSSDDDSNDDVPNSKPNENEPLNLRNKFRRMGNRGGKGR